MRPTAVIFDLDGVVFDYDHRIEHLCKEPVDWPGFHRDACHDPCNLWAYHLITSLHQSRSVTPIFLTNRRWDRDGAVTRQALEKHFPWRHMLVMRGRSLDHLTPAESKKELYRGYIEPFYTTILAVDDDRSVCDMWESLNIPALHVVDNWYDSELGAEDGPLEGTFTE